MIAPLAELKIFLDVDATDNSKDRFISPIHSAVEQWLKTHITWDPEEVTHTNKLYDGTGDVWLFLDELYLSAVSRVSYRGSALKVKNTATDATNAYVTVDSDSMTLVVEGGSSESSSDLTFSSYATLTAMVTAINAVGNSWSAAIYDSDFNSYKTSNLLQVYNLFCGSWNGAAATWEYLEMGGKPLSGVRPYPNRGALYHGGGFSSGHQNVAVSYTSGWAAASMPDELKQSVLIAVKYLYQKRNEEGYGASTYSTGSLRVSYVDLLPPETLAIWNNPKYRKLSI